MNPGFIPWADGAFDHWLAYQRAAFFVLGCIEREQLINLRALAAFWLGMPDGRPNAMLDEAAMPDNATVKSTPPPAPRAPSTSANESMFGGAKSHSRARAARSPAASGRHAQYACAAVRHVPR